LLPVVVEAVVLVEAGVALVVYLLDMLVLLLAPLIL
jgi:hypothetical protein